MNNMDTKEVAKLVRTELKTHFPCHKFSVRIERYSTGSSITVTWIDGPLVKDVKAITGHFQKTQPYSNDFIFFNRNYSKNLFDRMVEQMKNIGIPSYDREVEACKTLNDIDFYGIRG